MTLTNCVIIDSGNALLLVQHQATTSAIDLAFSIEPNIEWINEIFFHENTSENAIWNF